MSALDLHSDQMKPTPSPAFIEPGDDGDGTLPLFELADNAANGNKTRGHIALVETGERSAGAYFVDLGSTLKFSAQHAGEMTPETVRALGQELIAWADRKGAPTAPADANELRTLVDLLDEIDCHSFTLHATDRAYWSSRQPEKTDATRVDLRINVIGRTAFERLAGRLGSKVTERVVNPGQRAWHAEADTPTRRLLIEAVSFQHHDDWESRPTKEART